MFSHLDYVFGIIVELSIKQVSGNVSYCTINLLEETWIGFVFVLIEMSDCSIVVDFVVFDSRVLLFEWRRVRRVQAVGAMRAGI